MTVSQTTVSNEAVQYSRMINRSPIFYGWPIMLVGTLGLIMTSPGQTYAVSIFIEHFITDLGLNRSTISILYAIGTLVGSFALPFVGRQLDQHGPRRMIVLVSLIFGLACIWLGAAQNAFMLLLGFTGIRMFGQGSLGLVSQQVINLWWVRRRGFVNGLAGVMFALLGSGGFPYFIHNLIEYLDSWRLAYMLLGGMILLGMAPLGWLFFRDKPEIFGLFPDGDKAEATIDSATSTNSDSASSKIEKSWTLDEAKRLPVFWVSALGVATIGMLNTGLFFHMVSIFDDNQLSVEIAASVFIPIAITAAIVTLVSGVLVDYLPIRFFLSGALVAQGISLLLAQSLISIEVALLYGVVLGTLGGLLRTVHSVMWVAYYGRQHLGAISGLGTTALVAGSAFGPLPFAFAHDLLGSYNLALTISSLLPFFLAIAVLFFKSPTK
ncbi:MFS transporter [Anaerolineales bacterium HSG6]|nr:MFS transporter [Anaerolineales bacterium HSG6]